MSHPESGLPEGLESQATRMALLEHIIAKRVRNLEYLKRVFESEGSDGVLWMNTVKVGAKDLLEHFSEGTARPVDAKLHAWFCMGVSLAGLLPLQNGLQFVSVIETLLAEWEHRFATGVDRLLHVWKGGAAQAQSKPAAQPELHSPKSSPVQSEPPAVMVPSDATTGGKPTASGGTASGILSMFSKTVTFEYLSVPDVPMELSFSEVILSLSRVLVLVYRKFLDTECAEAASGISRVIRVDKKFKHHFFGFLSREIEKTAEGVLRNSQRALAQLFSAFTLPDGGNLATATFLADGNASGSEDESDSPRYEGPGLAASHTSSTSLGKPPIEHT
ncbi:hypothetical protein DIPPA_30626 [Diplonema papillatum]|nr:hypothetical protein DIPPA_30626 [Diplonema papillatum]